MKGRQKVLFKILVILLIASPLLGQQVWINKSFTETFGSVKVNLNDEMRFDESLYYHHIETGVTYWGKHWGAGLNYRKMYIYDEDMPHLNFYLKFKVCGLSVSDRNRMQYMINKEHWTYRNKLSVSWNPFAVINEVFLDDSFYRNRFYLGVNHKEDRFNIGVYYLRQDTGKDCVHAMCFNLKMGL